MAQFARRSQRMTAQSSTPQPVIELLAGKLFTSTAGQSSGYPLSNLTDGNTATRWISNVQSPATATVDLGGVYDLESISGIWAADTTQNYSIDISVNNSTWSSVATGATSGTAGAQTIPHTVSGKARYIRLNLQNIWNANAYGHSLYELEAYGSLDPSYPVGSISNFALTPDNQVPEVALAWDYSGSSLTNFVITRGGSTIATLTNTALRTYTDNAVSVGQSYTYTITGTYLTGGTSTNTMTASTTVTDPNATRDPFYQPFTSESFWNLPIVNGVATTDIPSLRAKVFTINRSSWSHGMVEGTDSDPIVTCTDTLYTSSYDDPAHPYDSIQWHIPSWAQPSSGSDAHLEVAYRHSDGRVELLEMISANRVDATHVTCSRMNISDLKGHGGGPANGVRAYGGSAIGGLIREWEVDPNHPQYTGKIEHALAIGIDRTTMLYKNTAAWNNQWGWYTGGVTDTVKQPGWNPGLPRYGYGGQTGFVWPATEQDYYSMASNEYGGNIPMGAYLCIPSSVDVTALGLNTEGLMVAHALQDYGGYVSDAVSNCSALYLEYIDANTNTGPFSSALGWDTGSALHTIMSQLRRVNTNNQNNPNGGPLGATRRQPQLPNF